MYRSAISTATIATRLSLRNSIPKPQNSITSKNAFFSTKTIRYDRFQKAHYPSHGRGPYASQEQNPSYPGFNFKGLGASRKVKFFVIACLAVVGTVESVFWIKVILARMSSSPTDEGRKPEGN